VQTWILVLLLACVAVAVVAAAQGALEFFRTREDERLRGIARRLGSLEKGDGAQSLSLVRQQGIARHLGRFGEWLEAQRTQAGGRTSMRSLLLQSLVAGIIGVVVLAFLLRSPLAILGLGFATLPIAFLVNQGQRRSRKISEQLPDAMDLVGRSLQAGHGISESMRACAMETPPPLAHEFGRVWEEHNLGLDFRDSLDHLVQRNPGNFDLRLFAGSVLLQRETGGNLVEIVENIANTIRGRFTLEAKVGALTSEARFSAMILGGLPLFVAAAILTLRPSYMQPLVIDPFGRWMLGYALLSYLLGALVLRRLAQIRT